MDLKSYKAKITREGSNSRDTIAIGAMFYDVMKSLIGDYEDHITYAADGFAEIDANSFSDASSTHSEFVWQMSKTQMFSSFIQGLRKDSVNPFRTASSSWPV